MEKEEFLKRFDAILPSRSWGAYGIRALPVALDAAFDTFERAKKDGWDDTTAEAYALAAFRGNLERALKRDPELLAILSVVLIKALLEPPPPKEES